MSKHQNPHGTAVRVKNGRFTIQSHTGEHRTFQLKTVISNDKKSPTAFCNKLAGKRILSLLIGPDNTSDYEGFAFVDDDGIYVWGSKQNEKFTALARCFWRFATEGTMDAENGYVTVEGMRGYMLCQGYCCRCNRPLTVPESIESGIGPVCAKKGML